MIVSRRSLAFWPTSLGPKSEKGVLSFRISSLSLSDYFHYS